MRRILGAALAAMFAAGSAQATHFTFTDTLTENHGPQVTVTGYFDGTLAADGNLITDITNPYVFVNGSAFPNNGHLFVFSISADYTAWELNAVASLDGQQNNFTFGDNDWPNNDFSTGEGDIYQSISSLVSGVIDDQHIQVFAGATGNNFRAFVDGTAPTPTPEPASWAMMVAGFGLAGATMRARRRGIALA